MKPAMETNDMFIKQIIIDATNGLDVIITHSDIGCEVHQDHKRIAVIERCDSDAEQFEHATLVAGAICGWSRDRKSGHRIPNATNSMIHDVWREMQRVAGC